MKIRGVFLTLIIIGIMLVPVLLYYIGESDFSQEHIYEANWDIHIPSDLTMIYHNQDKHDFQGKGNRYTVFETKEIYRLRLINMKNSSKEIQSYYGSSNNGTNEDVVELIQTITSDLNVAKNYLPYYDRYYVWQKFTTRGNTLIVLYFPRDYKIYFIEKLF